MPNTDYEETRTQIQIMRKPERIQLQKTLFKVIQLILCCNVIWACTNYSNHIMF